MKSVVFILLLAIGGSMGDLLEQCQIVKCRNMDLQQQIHDLGRLPPLEESLKKMCPLFLAAMDCVTDQILECTGQSMEELAASGNETVSPLMITFSSLKELGKDLCDEDNTLHKNYVSGITCFRNMAMEAAEECFSEGRRIYAAYKESVSELVEGGDNDEGECMVVGYGIACVSKKVRETCGGTTSDAFLEIIKRLKFMKLNYCKHPENLMNLQTKFLDYVEGQGEQRDIFASAFDFRRRK